MKDLLIGDTGNNLQIINFDLAFTGATDVYAAQKIRLKLSIFANEWYLNNTIGIDYFNNVLIKDPDINLIEDIFKTKILEMPEIQELISFEQEFDTALRKLTTTFKAKLVDDSIIEVTI